MDIRPDFNLTTPDLDRIEQGKGYFILDREGEKKKDIPMEMLDTVNPIAVWFSVTISQARDGDREKRTDCLSPPAGGRVTTRSGRNQAIQRRLMPPCDVAELAQMLTIRRLLRALLRLTPCLTA